MFNRYVQLKTVYDLSSIVSHRFELTRVPTPEEAAPADQAAPTDVEDHYRFARCAVPEPWQRMKALGVPLSEGQITVLYPDLSWEELEWTQQGVHIRGQFFQLVRLRFVPHAEAAAS